DRRGRSVAHGADARIEVRCADLDVERRPGAESADDPLELDAPRRARRVGGTRDQRRGDDDEGRRDAQRGARSHRAGSLTSVRRFATTSATFCTTPLGQRISQLSTCFASPSPKCNVRLDCERYAPPVCTWRTSVFPPTLTVTSAP